MNQILVLLKNLANNLLKFSGTSEKCKNVTYNNMCKYNMCGIREHVRTLEWNGCRIYNVLYRGWISIVTSNVLYLLFSVTTRFYV